MASQGGTVKIGKQPKGYGFLCGTCRQPPSKSELYITLKKARLANAELAGQLVNNSQQSTCEWTEDGWQTHDTLFPNAEFLVAAYAEQKVIIFRDEVKSDGRLLDFPPSGGSTYPGAQPPYVIAVDTRNKKLVVAKGKEMGGVQAGTEPALHQLKLASRILVRNEEPTKRSRVSSGAGSSSGAFN